MVREQSRLMKVLDIAACILLLPVIVLLFVVFFPVLMKLAELSVDWWFNY